MDKRRRVPRGGPGGGQFAAGGHAESGVALSTPDGTYAITGEEIVSYVDAAVSSSRVGRVDPDDLASEACTHYLTARCNALASYTPATPPGAALANPPAYIRNIVHGLLQRTTTGLDQSYERSALKEVLSRRAAFAQNNDRDMTAVEVDEVAEDVRSAQAVRHRAPAGFHRAPPKTIGAHDSLDRTTADGAPIHQPIASATGEDPDASRPVRGDSLAAEVISQAASRRPTKLARAHRQAWDALAEMREVPATRSITPAQAAATRTAVAEGGGVEAMTARWRDETGTEAETEALFAPFDASGYDDRAAVVDTLASVGDRADALYDSAVAGAAHRNDGRR